MDQLPQRSWLLLEGRYPIGPRRDRRRFIFRPSRVNHRANSSSPNTHKRWSDGTHV